MSVHVGPLDHQGARGRVARFLLPVALGCLVATAVFAQTAAPETDTDPVRLKHVLSEPLILRQAQDERRVEGPDTTYTRTAGDPIPQILLSRQLMQEAGVGIGDVVTLASDPGASRTATFRVAGTYEPTPDPRKFSVKRFEARLHLPDLIRLTADPADAASADVVSAINLALADRHDAAGVERAIERRVPGTMVEATHGARAADDPFAVLNRFHWAIAIVTVAGSTAFLLALMVMRAEERREIIGILRLMGVPSRSILVEVLLEGLLIAVAGAIFGILVAAAAQDLVNRFFQWRYDTSLVFVRVTAPVAWKAVAFAVPLGVVAGLVASWTLLRRSVAALMGR